MSAGICVTRPSPTESLVKTSAAAASVRAVPGDADDDAAEDVDGQNDKAGDRVAADEFRRTVHRTEEGAFLLELAPARCATFSSMRPGGEVGVDRHLLAGNGVEGEARPDLCDAGRALGDHQEVDRHQDEKDDDADDEIAAHDEAARSRR